MLAARGDKTWRYLPTAFVMAQIDNNNLTILVVDDDEDLRLLVTQMLRSEGYSVIGAANGTEAQQLALQHVPDLILMDIGLPGVDGLTTIWKMREEAELVDVPIIVLSAYDSYDLRGEAASAGCQGYLTKPLEVVELTGMVKRILAKS